MLDLRHQLVAPRIKLFNTVLIFAWLSFLPNMVLANFQENEKPVWAMLSGTAYTLNAGEWNLDLWGPITYGVSDNFQLGSIFWLWFGQIPNINAKYNLIAESPTFPAISLSASLLAYEGDFSGISAEVSKQLTPVNYISAVYTLGVDPLVNISSVYSKYQDLGINNPNHFAFSYLADMSPRTRFSAEVSTNLGDQPSVDFGAGFEWAMGEIFRLKLGIYDIQGQENPIYVPFIDLHWRFK